MNAIGKTALLALLPLSIILGGCSSPAERAAITPQGIAIAKHSGYVLVAYGGFRYQSGLWAALGALAGSVPSTSQA